MSGTLVKHGDPATARTCSAFLPQQSVTSIPVAAGSALLQTHAGNYRIAPTNGSNPTRRLARIVRVREAAAMRPEQGRTIWEEHGRGTRAEPRVVVRPATALPPWRAKSGLGWARARFLDTAGTRANATVVTKGPRRRRGISLELRE
jgi:hypothetical protein